jgi:hypothetical protein
MPSSSRPCFHQTNSRGWHQSLSTMELSIFHAIASLIPLSLIYGLIFRLYFSSISNIPGPKLAAATWWYEFYYDIITYGKYIFKIDELHKKYGPIVRISPYEVHVSDPDFFDILYGASKTNRKDRWSWYTTGLGIPLSTLGTIEGDLHRRRRAAMSSFFSKQTVRKLEPLIQERASTLASRLEVLANTGEVVSMNLAYAAFTNGKSGAAISETKS